MKHLIWLLVMVMLALVGPSPVVADGDVTVTAQPNYVPIVEANPATDITDTTATLHGNITNVGASNVTTRGFEWGYDSGNYTVSWNETGSFGPGTFSHNVTGLTANQDVYWRAFAINTEGRGNSAERSFFTMALPAAPTNFQIVQVSNTMAELTWTMGARADTTVIRGATIGYPASVTDGFSVYSGNATQAIIDSLNLDAAIYYFRAWSQNSYGYSLDYAEAYVGNPLGPQGIIFVIGLLGFAIWKKGWIRLLLSICIMIWGAFAMPYDIKIAAPLLAVGAVLFVMGILRIIKEHRAEQEPT